MGLGFLDIFGAELIPAGLFLGFLSGAVHFSIPVLRGVPTAAGERSGTDGERLRVTRHRKPVRPHPIPILAP